MHNIWHVDNKIIDATWQNLHIPKSFFLNLFRNVLFKPALTGFQRDTS